MAKVATSSVTPSDLHEVASGIFYASRSFVLLDTAIIAFLKERARSNPMRRARICAHPSPEDDQHDMLIVSHHDTYVAPHRHLTKSESFFVIEGAVTALLFAENGQNVEQFPMGSADSGCPFFYRMPARQYHSIAIESELLVFAESTKGPFRPDDLENASWAPGPQDLLAGRAFIAAVRSNR
jgi:cupin fold WbuC family metalloprotein